MANHQFARADLDRGEILDMHRAVAGQARSHEQRDVRTPREKRLFEERELVAPALHEIGEALLVVATERGPALHVDAAQHEGGVDAVMDVTRVDVRPRSVTPAQNQEVGIAGRVDHDLGEHGVASLLALEDRAADSAAVLDDRRDPPPGVQHELHLAIEQRAASTRS